MNRIKKVALEVKSLFEILFVGCVALLLPWSLSFRVLRWSTRFHLLRGEATADAVANMEAWLGEKPANAERLYNLHRLIDSADFFLTLKSSKGWMQRHLQVSRQDMPVADQEKGAIFITLHYGQGFWALKWLKDKGYQVGWLYAPPPKVAPLGNKLFHWIGRKRVSQVEHLCGAVAIPTGGSIEKMRHRLLNEKKPVLVMPDAPLRSGQSKIKMHLLGRDICIPAGALSMAADEKLPVFIYSVVADITTGHRYMDIKGPFYNLETQDIIQHIQDHYNLVLSRDPTAWHAWPWVSTFLDAP